jgi:hypothetical protein
MRELYTEKSHLMQKRRSLVHGGLDCLNRWSEFAC